jgi:hypothetical protein
MTFNFGSTLQLSPVSLLVGAFFVAVGWYLGIAACQLLERTFRKKAKQSERSDS